MCQSDDCDQNHCKSCRCHTVGNIFGGYCSDCVDCMEEEQQEAQWEKYYQSDRWYEDQIKRVS